MGTRLAVLMWAAVCVIGCEASAAGGDLEAVVILIQGDIGGHIRTAARLENPSRLVATSGFLSSYELARASRDDGQANLAKLFPMFAPRECKLVLAKRPMPDQGPADFILSISAGQTKVGYAVFNQSTVTGDASGWCQVNQLKEIVGVVPLSYKLLYAPTKKTVAENTVQIPLVRNIGLGGGATPLEQLRTAALLRAAVVFNRQLEAELGRRLVRKPSVKLNGNRIVFSAQLSNPFPFVVSGTIKFISGQLEATDHFLLLPAQEATCQASVVADISRAMKRSVPVSQIRKELTGSVFDMQVGGR